MIGERIHDHVARAHSAGGESHSKAPVIDCGALWNVRRTGRGEHPPQPRDGPCEKAREGRVFGLHLGEVVLARDGLLSELVEADPRRGAQARIEIGAPPGCVEQLELRVQQTTFTQGMSSHGAS